jgi:hypothetical protein
LHLQYAKQVDLPDLILLFRGSYGCRLLSTAVAGKPSRRASNRSFVSAASTSSNAPSTAAQKNADRGLLICVRQINLRLQCTTGVMHNLSKLCYL